MSESTVRRTFSDLRVFADIVREAIPAYALAASFIILASLASSLSPLILGSVIDYVSLASSNTDNTLKNLNKVVALLTILAGLQLLAVFLRTTALRISSTKAEIISHHIRQKLVWAVFHSHSNHWTFRSETRGKVLSLFNRDIEALWDVIGFAITEVIASIVLIVSLTAIIFIISPAIGMLFLVMALFFTIAFFDNGRRVRAFFDLAAPRFDRMLGLINAFLDGYETVISFRKQRWARSRIMGMSFEVTELANRAHQRTSYFTFTTGVMNTVGILIVWGIILSELIGANSTAKHTSIGELVAILFYFSMLTEPLESISAAARAFSKGGVSLNRLASFIKKLEQGFALNEQSSATTSMTDTQIYSEPALLRLRDVRDQIISDHQTAAILKPVSFEIWGGQMIGLAGASGSGKSTLLRILARLLPSEGTELSFKGVQFSDIDEDTFRTFISYISQIPNIFPVTLAENLFLSEMDTSEYHQLEYLARVGLEVRKNELSASEDILAEQLSGGEAQRLGLARIFDRSPQLLLIDEPTSALDLTNTLRVCDILTSLATSGNVGIIVASHDPFILKCCTVIHLMQDGEIISTGTVETLSRDSELFRSIIAQHMEE